MKTDKKYNEGITTVWRNGGFSASYDSFVVGSSAVLRTKYSAKKPRLRQAAKRYAVTQKTPINDQTIDNEIKK
ncbi:hypothetical protein [Rhodoflexus sp.]